MIPLAIVNAYITRVVGLYGYIALFLGLAVEGTGMPGPVQIFFFTAGYLIYQGKMSFLTAWIVTAIGNLVGNIIGYLIASFGGRPLVSKIFRFFGKDESGLERYGKKFSEKGPSIVFWGRLFGPIRTPAILAAGLFKYDLVQYTIFSALGAIVWSLFWLFLGLKTAQGVDILNTVLPNSSYLIVGGIALVVLGYLGWKYYQKRKKNKIVETVEDNILEADSKDPSEL